MIIAVASPPGAGKTHWIHQQIAQTNKPVGYFSPQTDSLPIDATYLQSEYPQLKLYRVGEEAELNNTIHLSGDSLVFRFSRNSTFTTNF